MLPQPPSDSEPRRVIKIKGSAESKSSRSTLESATPLTPHSHSHSHSHSHYPAVTIKTETFATCLVSADRHFKVASPGSEPAVDAEVKYNRRHVQGHILRWYQFRETETGFDACVWAIVHAVLGDQILPPHPPTPTQEHDRVRGLLAPEPVFAAVQKFDVQHYGTREKRVQGTRFWEVFAEVYNSGAEIEARVGASRDTKRLTVPDLMIIVASSLPKRYMGVVQEIKRQKKCKHRVAVAAGVEPFAARGGEDDYPLEGPSYIPQDLALDTEPAATTSTSSITGTESSATGKKRSRLATAEELIESLNEWFALPGLVVEEKVADYFVVLCQLLGYLVQLYEACGTRLGLLVNRAQFARVVLLPNGTGLGLCVAVETSQEAWWGQIKTMEQIDTRAFASHDWLPKDEVCMDSYTPPGHDSPLPPRLPATATATATTTTTATLAPISATYKVPNWDVVQRLVDYIELSRDAVKSFDMKVPPTRAEIEAAHAASALAAMAMATATAADADSGAGWGDNPHLGPALQGSAVPQQAAKGGQAKGPNTTGPLQCPRTLHLALGSNTSGGIGPAIDIDSAATTTTRAYQFIARGARALKSIPPPRDLAPASIASVASDARQSGGGDDHDGSGSHSGDQGGGSGGGGRGSGNGDGQGDGRGGNQGDGRGDHQGGGGGGDYWEGRDHHEQGGDHGGDYRGDSNHTTRRAHAPAPAQRSCTPEPKPEANNDAGAGALNRDRGGDKGDDRDRDAGARDRREYSPPPHSVTVTLILFLALTALTLTTMITMAWPRPAWARCRTDQQ